MMYYISAYDLCKRDHTSSHLSTKYIVFIVISVMCSSAVTAGSIGQKDSSVASTRDTAVSLVHRLISEKDGMKALARSSDPVSLYRYFNTENGDHLYTTNWEELGNGKWSYKYEGVAARVYPLPITGSVPLHRYYNSGNGDHFYTTNWDELGGGRNGYQYEGVTGYLFQNPTSNHLPLFRYYNSASGDHFYTTNWAELGGGGSNYKFEKIQAYVLPLK